MSATELLEQIERLPSSEQLWLLEKLMRNSERNAQRVEENAWSDFSAHQLLEQYAPEDSIYDED